MNPTIELAQPRSDRAAPHRTAGTHRAVMAGRVIDTLQGFMRWLDRYGETSWDHQSFFAGPIGRRAKAAYYRQPVFGTAAVAPMILCEAFIPSARRLFHRRLRFPIADAHYAMGFGYLYRALGLPAYFDRMNGFLGALIATRCPGYREYCWGYPFDWVTRNGTITRDTPLITTTPYVFDALALAHELEPRDQWRDVLASIGRHAATDIQDFTAGDGAATCSYTPHDSGGVINAAAYRASLLTSASQMFGNDRYRALAQRNLQFVLNAQNPDGSWFYAADGIREFVDHYHTCFVLKAIARIDTATGDDRCLAALARGVAYYQAHLFADDGLPKPFAKAPRLTTYTRELYDCAECINLCLLLKDRFPALEQTLHRVVEAVLADWVKPDGSFRSRRLLAGWDNVPMHRWGQAQMFRSLALCAG